MGQGGRRAGRSVSAVRGRRSPLKRRFDRDAGLGDDPFIAAPASRHKAQALPQGRPQSAARPGRPRLRLRLLGVTDLHANLYPYDYYRDRPDDSVGLARTASLIAEARKQAPNCLLFDNGDILQGTPLGDFAARAIIADKSAIHPVIAAMNRLNYDAATLGNHDFDYGPEALERAYGQARFPVVSCNLRNSDGSAWLPPSIVIERAFLDESGAPHRLKVGVIGVAPPQIAQWDEAHVRGRLTTVDIVEAARAELAELRAHVDLIIVLCHSGISRLASTLGEENAGRDLAKVDGVDALILGHQHLLLPGEDFAGIPGVDAHRGTIHGKPAVMAGFSGSHLGIIDLELEKDMGWRVAQARVEVRPIASRDANGVAVALVRSDLSVLEAAKAAHEATLAHVRTPVGRLAQPLSTYLALIGDNPVVKLINEAQRAYAPPLAAARADLASLPILSAAAPFKCGGRSGPYAYTDIAAGPIAIKDVADIYPYPNTLRVVRVDGATLEQWLERSASIFRRIDPTLRDDQPLLPPAFAAYNFDVIDGVEYAIDVAQPARYDESGGLIAPEARRIRDLKFKGAPVAPNEAFLVVTNNYRASGGGGFPGCDGTSVVIEAPDANRDVLLKYVASQTEIAPKSDGAWRFARWPAPVVATYLTSPAAATLPAPPGLKLTPIGLAPGGFLKLRVETV
jgi:2',3'-cyclic-nucleotide 2'-phosphodiesterase / 3'-nucleotidase